MNVGVDFQFTEDFYWIIKNSLIQAVGTGTLCIFFSILFLNQTLSLEEKNYRIIEKLLLGPAYVPSVFMMMVWLGYFNFFPMGNLSVIFVQTLIYCGFTTVYMTNLIKNKLGSIGFISEMYEVSRLTFFLKILGPFLKKEFLQLFIMITMFVFSSFAVPFIIGGGRGTNLEVYIFEKIYLDQQWSHVSSLVLIQFCVLMGLSYLSKREPHFDRSFVFSKYFTKTYPSYLIYFYLALIYGGLFVLFFRLMPDIDLTSTFLNQLIIGFQNSVTLFAMTSVFLALLTFVLIWLYYHNENLGWFKIFMSPSIILTGFSFYLWSDYKGWFQFVNASLVLVYIYFFGIFFFYFENKLNQIGYQRFISKIYGLSFWDYFRKIFLKQCQKEIILVFSLILLTCLSDFVFIQSIGGGVDTLGMQLEAYLSGYRIQYAVFIGILCLFITGLFYLILEKIYVEN